MAMNSLKDIYIDQLQDLHSANRQSLKATKKLVDTASNAELTAALERGVQGIEKGIEAVADVVRGHGEEPTDEFCKGMEGLVKEVHAHVLDVDFGDDDTRDAMIISQYQRMVHYALAGYGTVAAFARRLELEDDAAKLEKCLDETYDGDREMTRIATGSVNKAAA